MTTTPSSEAAALAMAVIAEHSNVQGSKVTARFDPIKRKSLTAEALAAAGDDVTGKAGPFQRSGGTNATRAAQMTTTDTRLFFQAADFTAKTTVRDDATIAGLYILDTEAA